MSTLKEFTTRSAENGLSIARKLLRHSHVEGKKGFAKRAIKYLVKKLKEKLDELEFLVNAVTTHGANPGKCVTLQRTSDGRLQVSGCTTFPHLIYARIWRWPDLRNHWKELQHLPYCEFGFDLNCNSVCVNPYHYKRTVLQSPLTLVSMLDLPSKTMNEDLGNSEKFTVGENVQNRATDYKINKSLENCPSLPKLNSVGRTVALAGKFFTQDNGYFKKCATAYWCTVAYNEYDIQIDSLFKTPSNLRKLQITGYVDSACYNNLSLGSISNQNRIIKSERVRLNIGQGIQLELKSNGDTWLRLLSKHQIFLQSPYLDSQTGHKSGETVYKIYPSAVIKIFDLKQCTQRATTVTPIKVSPHTGFDDHQGEPANKDFQNPYEIVLEELRRNCTLKLSFSKGWGPGYVRHSVEETPCWIEIFLQEAFNFIIKQM